MRRMRSRPRRRLVAIAAGVALAGAFAAVAFGSAAFGIAPSNLVAKQAYEGERDEYEQAIAQGGAAQS